MNCYVIKNNKFCWKFVRQIIWWIVVWYNNFVDLSASRYIRPAVESRGMSLSSDRNSTSLHRTNWDHYSRFISFSFVPFLSLSHSQSLLIPLICFTQQFCIRNCRDNCYLLFVASSPQPLPPGNARLVIRLNSEKDSLGVCRSSDKPNCRVFLRRRT